jgi:hypothetical protein
VVGCVLIAVLFLNANIGMAAFTGAVALSTLRLAEHEPAIRKMPWTPILMVCGVERAGGAAREDQGLDLFTELLRRSRRPARSPASWRRDRPDLGLQQHVGRRAAGVPAHRARPHRAPRRRRLRVATSMNVGATSWTCRRSRRPARCASRASRTTAGTPTYNKLLAWGLSMTIMGAVGCWLFF